MEEPIIDLTHEEQSSHLYCIKLQCAGSQVADGRGDVTVELHGDIRSTGQLKLERAELPGWRIVDNGGILECRITAPYVGNLLHLNIRKDGDAWSRGWSQFKVTVVDEDLHRSWQFESDGAPGDDRNNFVSLKPKNGVGAGLRASARRSSIFHCQSPRESEEGLTTIKVVFQVHHYTKDCFQVYILGNKPALGAWALENALLMEQIAAFDGSWRGDWELEVELDDADDVEFLYVLIDKSREKHLMEDGAPHKLSADGAEGPIKVQSKLQTPNRGDSRRAAMAMHTPSRRAVNPDRFAGTPLKYVATPARFAPQSFDADPVRHEAVRSEAIRNEPALDDADRNENMPRTPVPQEREKMNRMENNLKAARNLLRTKEREIATLRAQLMSTGDVRATKQVAIDELQENVSDLRSQVSTLKESLSDPIAEIFGQVDQARVVMAETIDSLEEELQDARAICSREQEELQRVRQEHAGLQEQLQLVERECAGLAENLEVMKREHAALQEELQLSKENSAKVPDDEEQSELDSLRVELERLGASLQLAEQERRDVEQLHSAAVEARSHAEERFWAEFNERKRLFNTVQELKGNIRVFCRMRPLKKATSRRGAQRGDRDVRESRRITAGSKSFEFDRVFGDDDSQEAVYGEIAGIVTSVLDGFNTCVFAYGQTGSGKTHTMSGTPEDPGMYLRALSDLFRLRSERSHAFDTSISVSMLEIYNETLKDLLLEDSAKQQKLEIKKGADGVYVPNLTVKDCHSAEDVWALIQGGSQNRACSATSMNDMSSRSHLIVSVHVQGTNLASGARTIGELHLVCFTAGKERISGSHRRGAGGSVGLAPWFIVLKISESNHAQVDLAGSERVSKSHAAGERLREAAHINKSLSALGDVFMAILARSPHVPFRNSKLTYLLQESIGGNSKTVMFVNVSSDEDDVAETNCSLLFASRVSKVELGAASKKGEGAELARLGRELNEMDSQKKALESKFSEAEAQRKTFESKLGESESQRKAFEGRLGESELQRKALEDKLGESESQRRALEGKLSETYSQRKALESRIESLQRELEKENVKRTLVDAKEKESVSAQKQRNVLQRAKEELEKDKHGLEDALADARLQSEQLNAELEKARLRLSSSEAESRRKLEEANKAHDRKVRQLSEELRLARASAGQVDVVTGAAGNGTPVRANVPSLAVPGSEAGHDNHVGAPDYGDAGVRPPRDMDLVPSSPRAPSPSVPSPRARSPTVQGTVRGSHHVSRPYASESSKRGRIEMDLAGSGVGGARNGRSVHFAPTVAGAGAAGGKARPAAVPSGSNGPSGGGAKRIVYAFGTRFEVPDPQMSEDDTGASQAQHSPSGAAGANSRKHPLTTINRPPQRVIAGSTPATKTRPGRRHPT